MSLARAHASECRNCRMRAHEGEITFEALFLIKSCRLGGAFKCVPHARVYDNCDTSAPACA